VDDVRQMNGIAARNVGFVCCGRLDRHGGSAQAPRRCRATLQLFIWLARAV
jgi:hypothetical protein